jgi:acyl-CoA synthetase (AMP-forming)/AMP-acid ligase II
MLKKITRVRRGVMLSHRKVCIHALAAIGVPDPKWGEAVKAVVTLKPGERATEEEIIEYWKVHLTRYKAPKSVDFVSELPKTGSGKIYKRGLKG